ncbi:MAG: GGDEF domain-containing protein, partial [Planctomycetota bacterium]|nr:GGDEF domain-containing protein [Planctomycetota bacterium]
MLEIDKILGSSQLPTVPTVALRLLELCRDPDVEMSDIVDTVKSDPAIPAKLLKATNSSFFSFNSEVTSLSKAVPLLGTTVVTSLAMSFSLVEAAMPSGPLADYYRDYWKQSVVQACAAELLAEPGVECEYFLAGLLIDLGKLAMLKTFPNEYVAVMQAVAAEQLPVCLIERRDLGMTHFDIGMALMKQWKLPTALVECVQHHHESPEELATLKDLPNFRLIQATNLAAAFGEYFCCEYKGHALKHIEQVLEIHPRFEVVDLAKLLESIKQRISEAENLFPVQADDFPDPTDLMAEASEHLAEVAMREHQAKAQATALHEQAERDKVELQTQNKELRQQAMHDPLTRLYNRNFFEAAIEREFGRCARGALPIGVIFADIDHFKSLNDNYGHPFGDYVLKRVSKVLNGVLRQSDVLARFGGEEFIVLVSEPTENGL